MNLRAGHRAGNVLEELRPGQAVSVLRQANQSGVQALYFNLSIDQFVVKNIRS